MSNQLQYPEITGFDDFQDTEPDALESRFQTNDPRQSVARQSVQHENVEALLSIIQREYPRIYKKIVLLWGSQELQDAFARWIFTDQQDRVGWPPEAANSLVLLSIAHANKHSLSANPKVAEWRDAW